MRLVPALGRTGALPRLPPLQELRHAPHRVLLALHDHEHPVRDEGPPVVVKAGGLGWWVGGLGRRASMHCGKWLGRVRIGWNLIKYTLEWDMGMGTAGIGQVRRYVGRRIGERCFS